MDYLYDQWTITEMERKNYRVVRIGDRFLPQLRRRVENHYGALEDVWYDMKSSGCDSMVEAHVVCWEHETGKKLYPKEEDLTNKEN